MAFKIYTKTGDKGSTSLIGGTKVSKSDIRIDAYGAVDELNAHIGLCRDVLADEQTREALFTIQNNLFVIGSQLACDPEKKTGMSIPELPLTAIQILESAIDRMEGNLPPLKNFILPGGHVHISYIHIARTVCRRAERHCVRLAENAPPPPAIIPYLNRLSDYLFVLARYTGQLYNIEDIPWKQ
ncbi:MAG: cob(I)yrinic acid a,c-diamide adenosyltransferase [Chitinophagaceae bacterium]|nr:cob(I)yrinic acid a,c-diamide adenosyltransferase [Chitinophagaceae bacterium]MCW5926632.1 cob(I)yrinic acid a,c-diamide adenosyltransferase [Chitinophagaceae bacterium]